jgi:hypothetical protein
MTRHEDGERVKERAIVKERDREERARERESEKRRRDRKGE